MPLRHRVITRLAVEADMRRAAEQATAPVAEAVIAQAVAVEAMVALEAGTTKQNTVTQN